MGGYLGFLAVIVVVGLLAGFRQTADGPGGLGLPLIGAGLLLALYVMFGGLPGTAPAPEPVTVGSARIVTEFEILSASMAIAFGLGLLAALHKAFGWLAGLIFGILIGFVLAEHYAAAAQEAFTALSFVRDLAQRTEIVLALAVALLLASLAVMVLLDANAFAVGFALGVLAGFAAICYAVADPRAAASPLRFVFLAIFEFCAPGQAAELTLFAAMMLSSVAMMAVFGVIPFTAGWISSRFLRRLIGR